MDIRNFENFQTTEERKTSDSSRKDFRKRSPTMLKLQWLAERLRKIDKIKAQLAAGTYSCDSGEVAKAILGVYSDEEAKIDFDDSSLS